MILLLGASGYVGQAFVRALQRRQVDCIAGSRCQDDYTRYDALVKLIRRVRPSLVINAAGYTGKPNVDRCEVERADTLLGNVALPLTISHACRSGNVPWAHVSTGCIYNGAKVLRAGQWCVETDLTRPELETALVEARHLVRGFSENDLPNFSFRQPPCSFYSGSKALAEELLATDPQVYIWRLRMPFDHVEHPRNYLTKLLRYPKLYENYNSLSHLEDFANACLGLWERRAPYGIYNCTNSGYVRITHVAELINKHLKLDRKFAFWESDEAFYREAATAPRSNCILETSKLHAAGIAVRPVDDAIADALVRWQAR